MVNGALFPLFLSFYVDRRYVFDQQIASFIVGFFPLFDILNRDGGHAYKLRSEIPIAHLLLATLI